MPITIVWPNLGNSRNLTPEFLTQNLFSFHFNPSNEDEEDEEVETEIEMWIWCFWKAVVLVEGQGHACVCVVTCRFFNYWPWFFISQNCFNRSSIITSIRLCKYADLSRHEERFYKQKSRVEWLNESQSCTLQNCLFNSCWNCVIMWVASSTQGPKIGYVK